MGYRIERILKTESFVISENHEDQAGKDETKFIGYAFDFEPRVDRRG